ncbi:hypothetical protein [Rugamonas sp.]|uniref:hypothetical protein n=1 Tax=Rugamonas sp. TaxID=1926287 RepID=UPI0025EA4E39|nr:hypothetical protein [Rugamonas sp.]
MPKINFADLDSTGKRMVFWLADEAKTVTSLITDAATHIGEIWEAAAFMKQFPEGTAERATLAERLQLGDRSAESIPDCLKRAVPGYRTLAEAADAELDELLADLKAYPGTVSAA